MRKLTILTLPIIVTGILMFVTNENVNAQNKKVRKKDLIGTWQLCSLKDSLPVTNYYGREDQRRYKLITPETFMVVDFIKKTKTMKAAFMGAYKIEKNKYTEFLEYTGNGYKKYLGEKNTFDIYIKDEYLFIKGTNNTYNEIWVRVKD